MGSATVIEKGSLKTVFASSKLTPCFLRFYLALSSCHSNSNTTKQRSLSIRYILLHRDSVKQAKPHADGASFKEALKQNASAIIVAHNHPSGDPTPSSEDVAVTREIVEAGKLLGVEVLDHLVIGQGRWVSLRERGLGFNGSGRR